MSGTDWLALAYGITKLHVMELDSRSECFLQVALNTGDGVSGVDGDTPELQAYEAATHSNGAALREGDKLPERMAMTLKPECLKAERGQYPPDSKDIASPAPASEDALAGTESGGEHPINSSPLHKFAEKSANGLSTRTFLGVERPREGMDEVRILASGSEGDRRYLAAERIVKSAFPESQIHSGDTITRLMDAVERCEERSRR